MTREQIEKAANIEMLSHYADGEYPWGINDIQSDFIEAFSKGAQWRINSVWHKPPENVESLIKEKPVVVKLKRNYLLLLGKFEEFRLYDGDRDSDGNYSYTMSCYFLSTSLIEYALSDVLEYAYLSDLLPERKEETE